RRPDPVDPRVGEHNVEATKLLDRRIDRALDRLGVAHIALDIQRPAAERADLVAGTLPRLGLHIGEHHMRTLLREAPRRAGANPARRTRDKRDLVIEHAHGSYILSGEEGLIPIRVQAYQNKEQRTEN